MYSQECVIAFHKLVPECGLTQTNDVVPSQKQVQQNSRMMSTGLHQSQLMFSFTYAV